MASGIVLTTVTRPAAPVSLQFRLECCLAMGDIQRITYHVSCLLVEKQKNQDVKTFTENVRNVLKNTSFLNGLDILRND